MGGVVTEDPEHPDRWLVIGGRRWRRTDPSLPQSLVESLQSQLGAARAAVRTAQRAGDDAALAAARHRVGLAKHGLGERGEPWWQSEEPDRLARAEASLAALERAAQR
jgi:hypothetical protein